MKQIFLNAISLEKGLDIFFKYLESIDISHKSPEIIKTTDSLGRITASPIFAKYSSPFYHSAAMDGYAVRSFETFTASDRSPLLLKIGEQAVYVDTGDPMPDGFDAVIMIEDVNIIRGQNVDEYIEIYQPVTPYHHVRAIGEDIVSTELIIPENYRIRPIDIGAMLASGNFEIPVRKIPNIAVIPTGTELISIEDIRDRHPRPPEIIEYNSHVVAGLLREYGVNPIKWEIVRDDIDLIRDAIKGASKIADSVIIIAGSGRGSEDFTFDAISSLGEVIVHGIAIKPGKPIIIGFVNNKPIFGLPGYPVSTYITMQLFVKPMIEKMIGNTVQSGKTIKARLSRQASSSIGIDEFIRVKVGFIGDTPIATPIGRGAGLLMSIVRADGIIKIPNNVEALSAGTEVDVELIRDVDDIKNTIVCIGSHDSTLDVLANFIKKRYPQFSFSSAHVGSLGGIMAIKRGEAHIAGIHLLDEQTGEYNVPFIKRLLKEEQVILINLVHREQGLLVKKGNPKKIMGFEDLTRDDVVFINRQSGSGTRLLFDKCIRERGINPSMIKGYNKEEFTHMTIASAVKTGLADTGLAIYSAAVSLGLDFIPVAKERYDLIIPKRFIDDKRINIVLDIIRNDNEFREFVMSLGGYDTSDMGKVVFG